MTRDNDLLYWGLDYPPLTAYVSYVYGRLAQLLYPPLVELHTSRGHETDSGKTFMRCSVLILDILIFMPAMTRCVLLMKKASDHRIEKTGRHVTNYFQGKFLLKLIPGSSIEINILACLLIPSLLLIDHGHFQYNCVCIGLALAAAVAMVEDRDVLASFLFCMSLNFKQMALYYSPVFFFALLRKCYDKGRLSNFMLVGCLWHLFKIGATVILSFAALWLPFCFEEGGYLSTPYSCVDSLSHVLSRQFPFNRGIFEDKVSNIWYCTSIIVDFRTFLSREAIIKASAALTLVLLVPMAVNLLLRPLTMKRLMLSLVNSSLAFFLASYQVHEKSLLLALVPACVLLPIEPLLMSWFQILGTFTMFPLLKKDGLTVPYFACCVLFVTVILAYKRKQEKVVTAFPGDTDPVYSYSSATNMKEPWKRALKRFYVLLSASGVCLLHYLYAFVPPTVRYPDLYPALFAIFGAGNLFLSYVYFISWQCAAE